MLVEVRSEVEMTVTESALSRIIGDTVEKTGFSSKHFSYVLHVEVAVVRYSISL